MDLQWGDDGVGGERGMGGNWGFRVEASRPLGGAKWPLGQVLRLRRQRQGNGAGQCRPGNDLVD